MYLTRPNPEPPHILLSHPTLSSDRSDLEPNNMNKSCTVLLVLLLLLASARCQGAAPPAPVASATAACQTGRVVVDQSTLTPSVATNHGSVRGADVKGFAHSRDDRHGGHVSVCVSAVSRSASGDGDGKSRTLRKNSAITPSGTSAAAVDAPPQRGAPCGSEASGLGTLPPPPPPSGRDRTSVV